MNPCCPVGRSPRRSARPTPRTWRRSVRRAGRPGAAPALSLVADAGEVCSCDLLEPLGKSQPTVSHHTKVLAEAGLILGEKRGRWVWWRIVPERLDAIRGAVCDDGR